MRYLLGTNVISELVAKFPNKAVVQWIDALDPDSVYLSVITLGEICNGVEKLPECPRKLQLREWLSGDLLQRFADRILILDAETMLFWGEQTARLEQTGNLLPAIDSLLAAQALVNHCTLVTRNTSDFMAAGVSVIDPWKSEEG